MTCQFASLLSAVMLQGVQSQDPNRLPIGRQGSVTLASGGLYNLTTGHRATILELAKSAQGRRYVLLGEQHATSEHQNEEAAVITALAADGRTVSVGVEMFQRPVQDVLDQWSGGKLSESEFLSQSDWKHQWGYDYAFYRPVFEEVRTLRAPLIGLNVPRSWVHQVGVSGFDTLPTSARIQLPRELFLANTAHRQVFDSLMGGHSTSGAGMDGMYAAQVLWDEGMAATAIKVVERQKGSVRPVMVIIAGAGHVMYGQGINYRIKRRNAGTFLSVVMLQSARPVTVSRGLADYVFVSPPANTPGSRDSAVGLALTKDVRPKGPSPAP